MRLVDNDAVLSELDHARTLEKARWVSSGNKRIDERDGFVLPTLLSH